MKKFRKEVRAYYQIYYENGDKAHLIDHADSVCDLDFIIIRSMKFYNANAEDVHRYGTKGYANYPKVYHDIFAKELKVFKELADKLTIKKILEIWKKNVGCFPPKTPSNENMGNNQRLNLGFNIH